MKKYMIIFALIVICFVFSFVVFCSGEVVNPPVINENETPIDRPAIAFRNMLIKRGVDKPTATKLAGCAIRIIWDYIDVTGTDAARDAILKSTLTSLDTAIVDKVLKFIYAKAPTIGVRTIIHDDIYKAIKMVGKVIEERKKAGQLADAKEMIGWSKEMISESEYEKDKKEADKIDLGVVP